MPRDHLLVCALLAGIIVLTGCGPAEPTSLPEAAGTALASAPAASGTASLTPTPQPRLTPVAYGPDLEGFPTGYNPLTGRPVQDAALLDLPAVLVSISNMPVTARPQAGPGFAPWVFELFIGEGTTRFMGVFYGDYPRYIPNVSGDCPLRSEIIRPTGPWVGNRVWLDENLNGKQDAWEAGVGGVCVRLYDAASGELLQSTSSDSNGYYAFEIASGGEYRMEFVKPQAYEFTRADVDNDDQDSDADPASGRTRSFRLDAADPSWDAGLMLLETPTVTPSPVVTGTPPAWYLPLEAYVGPIRSGRLTYEHIYRMFPASCLVYASAGRGIREALSGCEIIFGVDLYDPNSALLTVTHMRELAEASKIEGQPVNYAGNLFSDNPPAAGQAATGMWVFYHYYSQSYWQYDPISNTYLRLTDKADGKSSFIPAGDRLSGRQQAFENVIVVEAEYSVFRHGQYDIELGMARKGYAYLFRDGQVFQIYWSTANREWEQKTGLLRPIHFVDGNDNPIPLRPGRTWIHLVTPDSYLEKEANGEWILNFVQPYDPPDTPLP